MSLRLRRGNLSPAPRKATFATGRVLMLLVLDKRAAIAARQPCKNIGATVEECGYCNRLLRAGARFATARER